MMRIPFSFKKIITACVIVLIVLVIGFLVWANGQYVVPILAYHNISDHRDKFSLNNVHEDVFDRQMKFLKDNNFKVISFDDYVQGVKQGKGFGRKTVVIHFDDGYEDNYTHAFPILKKYGFPATIFLVSDSVGERPFLTWPQIKEMEPFGIDFGCHTRRHAYLPDLSLEEAVDEIKGCKEIVERNLGHPIKYFVYPSGGFNDAIKGLIQEAGFEAAATTNRGRDRLNKDLFELNRIRPKTTDQGLIFAIKVSGYYNLFRSSRCKEHCGKESYAIPAP